ncbi:MAG: DegT/DnrJ/EryC1/StrS family aminotransferase, partial [Phycicoccus sp.]
MDARTECGTDLPGTDLYGGVVSGRIHLSKADVTELEAQYVLEAVRSGWVTPLGPMVDRFEALVAERVGAAGALALSSGTAALHLALLHLGAAPGRVVLVPSMTFAASANAVVYTGADPVFVDSSPADGNVDAALLVEALDTLLAEGRDVAAVMTVDLFGRCADYEAVVPALEARGIPLVEDAAEALGATYRGRPAGSFGAAAALSFNGNKIM